MTRRRLLMLTSMTIAIGIMITGVVAGSTITNPSIENAATISTIDPIKANAYLDGAFGVDLIAYIMYALPGAEVDITFSVELWKDGFLLDSKIGETHTFHHRIYRGLDDLYHVQRDEIGPDYQSTSDSTEAETWVRTLQNAELATISSSDDYYIKVQASLPGTIGSDTTPWAQSPTKNIQVISPPSILWSSEVMPGQTITVNVNELLDFAPIVVYNDGEDSPEGYVSVVTDSHYLQLLNPAGYLDSTTAIYDGQNQRVYFYDGRQDYFDGYLADAYKVVNSQDYVGFQHLEAVPQKSQP